MDAAEAVAAFGKPIPSARFMGGREIETLIGLDTRQIDIAPDQPALPTIGTSRSEISQSMSTSASDPIPPAIRIRRMLAGAAPTTATTCANGMPLPRPSQSWNVTEMHSRSG